MKEIVEHETDILMDQKWSVVVVVVFNLVPLQVAYLEQHSCGKEAPMPDYEVSYLGSCMVMVPSHKLRATSVTHLLFSVPQSVSPHQGS